MNRHLAALMERYNTQEELAWYLGVDQSCVSRWLAAGGFPPKRALQIEVLTEGKFKAINLVTPSSVGDI